MKRELFGERTKLKRGNSFLLISSVDVSKQVEGQINNTRQSHCEYFRQRGVEMID